MGMQIVILERRVPMEAVADAGAARCAAHLTERARGAPSMEPTRSPSLDLGAA